MLYKKKTRTMVISTKTSSAEMKVEDTGMAHLGTCDCLTVLNCLEDSPLKPSTTELVPVCFLPMIFSILFSSTRFWNRTALD